MWYEVAFKYFCLGFPFPFTTTDLLVTPWKISKKHQHLILEERLLVTIKLRSNLNLTFFSEKKRKFDSKAVRGGTKNVPKK
jgi:hypothetical protein